VVTYEKFFYAKMKLCGIGNWVWKILSCEMSTSEIIQSSICLRFKSIKMLISNATYSVTQRLKSVNRQTVCNTLNLHKTATYISDTVNCMKQNLCSKNYMKWWLQYLPLYSEGYLGLNSCSRMSFCILIRVTTQWTNNFYTQRILAECL